MSYTAIYSDPWDEDGATADGTRVSHEIRLRISSNIPQSEDGIKKVLRDYLSERFKITHIKEEKIRIERS